MAGTSNKRPSDRVYFVFFLSAAIATLYFNQVFAALLEHLRLIYPLLATGLSFFGYYLGIRAVRKRRPLGRVLQIVFVWNLLGVTVTLLGSTLLNWLR